MSSRHDTIIEYNHFSYSNSSPVSLSPSPSSSLSLRLSIFLSSIIQSFALLIVMIYFNFSNPLSPFLSAFTERNSIHYLVRTYLLQQRCWRGKRPGPIVHLSSLSPGVFSSPLLHSQSMLDLLYRMSGQHLQQKVSQKIKQNSERKVKRHIRKSTFIPEGY